MTLSARHAPSPLPVQATARNFLTPQPTQPAGSTSIHRLQRLSWSDPNVHPAPPSAPIRVRMEAWRGGELVAPPATTVALHNRPSHGRSC